MPPHVSSMSEPALRVLDGLKTAITQREFPPLSRLPSERDLVERYKVDRHHIRMALRQLAREGLVRHVGRVGTLVEAPATPAEIRPQTARLRCITFVSAPLTATGTLREAVERVRLAAYTDALDGVAVKMRFSWLTGASPDFNALLAPDIPLTQQGCVLIDSLNRDFMLWLNERRVPYAVQYFTNYSATGLPDHHSVFVNKVQAAFDSTRHLIDLGHRRIGFMGPLTQPEGDLTIHNFHGYLGALRYCGVDHDPSCVLDFDSDDVEDSLAPARRMLSLPDRPTAMVTQTDANALAFLRAAKEMGLRVPADFSVIGFNDQEEAARSDPPLTTFSTPRYDQGRTVVAIVLAAAEGRIGAWRKEVMPCQFVLRSSTGPVPAGSAPVGAVAGGSISDSGRVS